MPIMDRNFTKYTVQDIPVSPDGVYLRCNFSRLEPIEVAGQKRGVRLFPDDDTPLTFIECNLCNCERPPGSTIDHCLTVIKEFAITLYTEMITVDGQSVEAQHYGDRIHGRLLPDGQYEYKDTPEDVEMGVR